MNFFDKLSKKATETYQFTKEKTSKISTVIVKNSFHILRHVVIEKELCISLHFN